MRKQWYEGFAFTPLPVMHGADFESMGFAFGSSSNDSLVVYLSDVSQVLESTLQWIEKQGPVKVLIVDCLFTHRQHSTHFMLPETLDCIRAIRPAMAFLTGYEYKYFCV
jgi:phosphoribosyl 1,2-cyclic phosphodiesterase